MEVILYTLPGNRVAVGRVRREDGSWTSGILKRLEAGMTIDAAFEDVAQKGEPADTISHRVIDVAMLPGGDNATGTYDRTFFGAFRAAGAAVTIDMPAARKIHAARILEARRAFSRDLMEREFMGEDVTAGKAQLAAMDVSAKIAAVRTPKTLNAVWPADLPRPA